MQRQKVESSNIVSIGYNEQEKVMDVEFAGSAVYRYKEVAKSTFDDLMSSESKGRFIRSIITTHKYHKFTPMDYITEFEKDYIHLIIKDDEPIRINKPFGLFVLDDKGFHMEDRIGIVITLNEMNEEQLVELNSLLAQFLRLLKTKETQEQSEKSDLRGEPPQ